MCPFTFLLQYLVYLFIYFFIVLLFSEKKFNFKKYLSKAIDSLGTKHGFKSIMHYGSKVFSKNKTYHRCQERRGKFNKNALY